jgi:hypothetical protein
VEGDKNLKKSRKKEQKDSVYRSRHQVVTERDEEKIELHR